MQINTSIQHELTVYKTLRFMTNKNPTNIQLQNIKHDASTLIIYQFYSMGRFCVGRFCYGPFSSWAIFVMGRFLQHSYIDNMKICMPPNTVIPKAKVFSL